MEGQARLEEGKQKLGDAQEHLRRREEEFQEEADQFHKDQRIIIGGAARALAEAHPDTPVPEDPLEFFRGALNLIRERNEEHEERLRQRAAEIDPRNRNLDRNLGVNGDIDPAGDLRRRFPSGSDEEAVLDQLRQIDIRDIPAIRRRRQGRQRHRQPRQLPNRIANMAAPGGDPMKNIPKFYGDQSADKLDAFGHLEAFDDYLRAYNISPDGPVVAQAGENMAQARNRRIVMIFQKFGFSLQAEAKTWFNGFEPKFQNPGAAVPADWDRLRLAFKLRFNPYGRTREELNIEWNNIKADPRLNLDTIWKKIETVGGGLGKNDPELLDKLRMCVPPLIYPAVMEMNDAQRITAAVRQIDAYNKTHGMYPNAPATQMPTTQQAPAANLSAIPPFLLSEQFNASEFVKPRSKREVPKKVTRKLRALEEGIQNLMQMNMDMTQQIMIAGQNSNQNTGRSRGWDRNSGRNWRGRDRSYSNGPSSPSSSRSPSWDRNYRRPRYDRDRDSRRYDGRDNRRNDRSYNSGRDNRRDSSPPPKKQVRFQEKLLAAFSGGKFKDRRNKSPDPPRGALRKATDSKGSSTDMKCYWCKKTGHGWRNCFAMKNFVRQLQAFKKLRKSGNDSDSDSSESSDDDDEAFPAFEDEDTSYQELLNTLKDMGVDSEALLNN